MVLRLTPRRLAAIFLFQPHSSRISRSRRISWSIRALAGGGPEAQAQGRREVPGLHLAAFGQDHGVLHRVFQLPDIAGPGVIQEQAHGLGAELQDLLAPLQGKTAQEMEGQPGDIVFPVPEGRQDDGDDVEAIEEVFPEGPFFDLGQEILVGGGQDAHIHGQGLLSPQALEFAGLQDPEQFDLGRRGNFADLIEKDRAAVGLLETPRLLAQGPGEGALFVAKELAFQQGGGIGGAIDHHKRTGSAGAVGMNGPGHQFLAGAALSLDEDGGVRGRHVFDELIDDLHLGVFADEAAKPGGGVHPASQGADFFFMLHGPPERPGVLVDDQAHQLEFFLAAGALGTGDDDGPADLAVIEGDDGLALPGGKIFRDQGGLNRFFREKVTVVTPAKVSRAKLRAAASLISQVSRRDRPDRRILPGIKEQQRQVLAAHRLLELADQGGAHLGQGAQGADLPDDFAGADGLIMGPLQLQGLLFQALGIFLLAFTI